VVEPLLRRAAGLALDGTSPDAVTDLVALRALVAHDLGRTEHTSLTREAEESGAFGPEHYHSWVLVRAATERGDLEEAQRADAVPLPEATPPAVRQLRDCASAALAMELGRLTEARQRLLDVLEVADRTGATLMVPEAATRLVMLEAPDDLSSARRRFELFEWAAGGESWLPRETVLRLLARAAVRAADRRPDDAASAAAAAADTAESTGLVHLAVAAHRRRAGYLTAAGRPSESRLATAAASRWRDMARQGVPEPTQPEGQAVHPANGPQRPRLPRQDGVHQPRERRDDPPERSRRGG
jgi:hypothetical protein